MTIKPLETIRALSYPLVEPSVLVPLIFFWLLLSLASWGGVLGLFMMFLLLPAVLRYQMILLEARARGMKPEVPGIEFFNWFGNGWTLFPVVIFVILVWVTVAAGSQFGSSALFAMLVFSGLFFPACIAVLAITHSPLQSVNPIALARLWKKCAATFWQATVYLVGVAWVSMQAEGLPMMLAVLLQLALFFSFFSLVGSLIQPYGLIEDIDIPEMPQQDEASVASAAIEKSRINVLSHAYGFISRGNRDGGLNHLLESVAEDPDPVAARLWYFERMLTWDNTLPALFFAQHNVRDHLQHGEQVPAVKLIMRCRLIDAQFRPFPEDLEAAILAAEASDNPALAADLRRH
ncbi:MAG: hypothetical protein KJO09_09810 [Gammaproteobacteria bacterium]|nr:hypothetical protein [Gammaproteobacteria bacterium]